MPLGRPPNQHVYYALTPADVLTNSAEYQSAITTRGVQSEYGTSSFGAFVQLGIYVP